MFYILYVAIELMCTNFYGNISITKEGKIALTNDEVKVKISCKSDVYRFIIGKYVGGGKKLVETIITKDCKDTI